MSISGKLRAVVLAGGKGTRLRPLTAVFPKPLVPIGDRPILEILLTRLKNTGLTDVVVSTGYLAELVMAICGDGSKYGLDVTYVREDEPLGTAGSLALLEDFGDNVIVMNGDLLTTLSFQRMIESHQSEDADITIAIHPREVKIDFGVVDFDESGFQGFREKPVFNYHVSMGVNILSQRVQKYIEPNKYLDMPDLILKVHENGGKVNCFSEECYWLDIGRMDDYAQAQEDFSQNEQLFLS